MVSIEDTVTVDADTYSHALPDWFEGDEITIEITAFGDKLYFDVPDYGRIERKIESNLEKDGVVHGNTDDYPVDWSDYTDRDEVIDKTLDLMDVDRSYVSDRTSQFCMNAEELFYATVRVQDRGGLSVDPILRKMNVLRRRTQDFVTGDDTEVTSTVLGSKSDADPAHLKLVEEFTTTIAGFQDDEYWVGYKRAASQFGDGLYDWADVAWDCFDEQWDGNAQLMLDVGQWLAREGLAVCSRSRAFFPAPEWVAPTGSYVATVSDVYKGTCPHCGADKSDHWECIKSPASTRRPSVYKCDSCGNTKRGITTG